MLSKYLKRQGESFSNAFSTQLMAKSYFEGSSCNAEVGTVKTITFQVTENCSLNCSYCYEINKSNKSMDLDIARKFIDLLIEDSYKEDSFVYIGNTQAVILEFIGGEPLLEIDLIHDIVDYFLYKTISEKHPWSINFMISMISNGVHYFEDRVQELFSKYNGRISFSMSLDGCKELHDACRVFPNGEGSYDIVEKACLHYMKNYNRMMSTKLTIAPENIDYMFIAFKNLLSLGYKVIYANPIYEENWNLEYAKKYYNELKKMSDYILDNDLERDVYLSLFDSNLFKSLDDRDNYNYCGSTGCMLSLDYKGDIYPCIRFMSISLGNNIKPYKIGDINNGIGKTKSDKSRINLLDCITRKSQSTKGCLDCPIGSGCGWCTAYNYQVTNSPNKRLTYICNMHKARSLANVYHWNKVHQKNNENDKFKMHLPKGDAINMIDKTEYEMLYKLQD